MKWRAIATTCWSPLDDDQSTDARLETVEPVPESPVIIRDAIRGFRPK